MSLFSVVHQKVNQYGEKHRKIDRILTHPRWVVRGYVFLVEHEGKLYILVNYNDLELAIARLPAKTINNTDFSTIYSIPVSANEEEMQRAICGVFTWASRLR